MTFYCHIEKPLVMQDIARTFDTLSVMIAANHRRSKLYHCLADRTENSELRPLFTHYADQSRHFVSSLSTWRSVYGLATSEKGAGSFGPWSQVRSLLTLGFRQNMLAQCEDLEQEMIRMYGSAISMSFMPPATLTDVQRQVREFERALAKIRLLRERPAAARELFARA
jgi:uncharacterized protein (TIGR02284 family)